MAGEISDLSDVEPFEITRRADETGGEFVRFEMTLHPSPDASNGAPELSHERWIVDLPDEEHVHPRQEEYLEVLAGECRVSVEGSERTLEAGEHVTLPPNVPHSHWNPSGRPSRIRLEHRPPLEAGPTVETLYLLAQAGEAADDGRPNFLQFAVLQATHPDHAYLTTLPVSVQKVLFRVLAPVGRLAGYRATYSREDLDAVG